MINNSVSNNSRGIMKPIIPRIPPFRPLSTGPVHHVSTGPVHHVLTELVHYTPTLLNTNQGATDHHAAPHHDARDTTTHHDARDTTTHDDAGDTAHHDAGDAPLHVDPGPTEIDWNNFHVYI